MPVNLSVIILAKNRNLVQNRNGGKVDFLGLNTKCTVSDKTPVDTLLAHLYQQWQTTAGVDLCSWNFI